MITRSRRPFSLGLGKKEGLIYYLTRFTSHLEDLVEAQPVMQITENQDVYLHFDAPPDYRFTMDGLDVVTIPGMERKDGQTYITPSKFHDILLFKGEDFPLVPGYYVITVTHHEKAWYTLLEVTPKYMGKQSWQDMRDELMDEIKTLSFDFMKKNIHISKAMEGTLGLNTSMLLRFYTISDESPVVLNVLEELSHTANSRLVLREKQIRFSGGRRMDPHIRPQHVKMRQGASSFPVVYTEMTWDIPENRFVKAILERLDRSLFSFIREIKKHSRRLESKQQELIPYSYSREYKMGAKALKQFEAYAKQAQRIRSNIRRVTLSPWYEETKNEMPSIVPVAVFRDPRYSVLYRLHKNMEHPSNSMDISNFYQFQWKRTDKLYELWGCLQFIKALVKKGWELEDGVTVIKEEGKYRLSSLESGTKIQMSRGEEEIHLTYDGLVPSASADTDREHEPLYTNNAHRRPDLRLDYYQKHCYCGSLVVDFKYRDILFLWQDENRGEGLRRQFNAYRDMNTRFYRNMDERTSLRDSRPVKEVWAVFPRAVPGKSDQDYSLKFIPLAPGQESNKELPELLENYLCSLAH